MNVYLLDWRGTLDGLKNPHGFVRALQSLGHKVVVFTGDFGMGRCTLARRTEPWTSS